MASRTFKTPDDVDLALAFLGRTSNPQVDAEAYFQARVQKVVDEIMKEATEKQFNLAKELLDPANKGASLKQIRDMLGVPA